MPVKSANQNNKPAPTGNPPPLPNQKPAQPPPPSPQNVRQERTKVQQEFEEAFKDFHQKHFLSKVLEDNKSAAAKKTEQAAIDRMVKAAVALDNTNVGEGVWALLIVAIREQLSVRDKVNQLEYELCLTKKDMESLKKELGIENGQKK